MSAYHDHSGDYGYDLVQEVKAALHLPSARRKSLPAQAGRASAHEFDPDGDLGYDQAHDL